MLGEPAGRLRSVARSLQPPARIVDWSIFVGVLIEAGSGLLSLVGATPAWAPLFWLHRAVGLTLIVLLGFKLARVRHRVTDPGQWQPSTILSVVVLLVATVVIGSGIVWVFGFAPEIPLFTLLTVHAGLGLLLVVLMGAHLYTRFRPPRRADFHRRRTTMQYSVLLIAGAVTYRGQEILNELLGTDGADRRFTGSQRTDGDGNSAFPVTSWVADDPDPIETEEWDLTVRGEVGRRLELDYGELAPDTAEEALLDCTSGWYTVQEWQGVCVGELLDASSATGQASHVRFVSVTGYRWTLPIEEARDALLATHVGDERLSHGHGAPMRLVAPGRRGFQWVKWVERVDVRQKGDPAQWIVTLISGFTD